MSCSTTCWTGSTSTTRRSMRSITLDPERARAAAGAADDATARGEDLGPLHGLPMTVKDVVRDRGHAARPRGAPT